MDTTSPGQSLALQQQYQPPAITIYDRMDPLTAITTLGEIYSKSGLFGCTKIEQGQVLAMACIAERKSPFELLKTYHLIEGKLAMRADAMLAKFQAIGGRVKWISKLNATDKAQAIFSSPDGINVDFDAEYTIEDAKRDGLADKKNYKNNLPDMLRARLITKMVRMFTPGINTGLYDPQEMGSEFGEVTDTTGGAPLLGSPTETEGKPAAPVQEAEVITDPTPTPTKSAAPKPAATPVAKPVEKPAPVVVEKPAPVVEKPAAAPVEAAADEDPFGDAGTPPSEEPSQPAHPLDSLLGSFEADANKFLVFKKYIQDGQTYRDLSEEMVKRVQDNLEVFKKQISKHLYPEA